MFDWPPQSHTSPTRTFATRSVFLPETVISAAVAFAGRSDHDAGLFQAETSAIVDVTAADSPPFARCEQAQGDPVDLRTGNIAMTIMMTQDGFAMTGTLSTAFCSCSTCQDTI